MKSILSYIMRHKVAGLTSASISAIVVITLALSACGIKPDNLEPPNSQENTYQQTYPDISTDPR